MTWRFSAPTLPVSLTQKDLSLSHRLRTTRAGRASCWTSVYVGATRARWSWPTPSLEARSSGPPAALDAVAHVISSDWVRTARLPHFRPCYPGSQRRTSRPSSASSSKPRSSARTAAASAASQSSSVAPIVSRCSGLMRLTRTLGLWGLECVPILRPPEWHPRCHRTRSLRPVRLPWHLGRYRRPG